jgi:hypothetical protein
MKYKQRKYCEDCEAPFFFTTTDQPNSNELCPVDSGHSTRDHTVLTTEGSNGFFIESNDPQSTSESDWQDAMIVPITLDEYMKYLINFSCEVYNSANNAVTSVRVIIDDVEYAIHNADCEVDGGEKLEKLVSGLVNAKLTAESHTLKVQWRARSGTAYIRRIKVAGQCICFEAGGGYENGGS